MPTSFNRILACLSCLACLACLPYSQFADTCRSETIFVADTLCVHALCNINRDNSAPLNKVE